MIAEKSPILPNLVVIPHQHSDSDHRLTEVTPFRLTEEQPLPESERLL